MLIGISGKIQSGKDTIGSIIQYLIDAKANFNLKGICEKDFTSYVECLNTNTLGDNIKTGNWKVVKYADALKDIVCILTGCTREQLESDEFKTSKLSDEWIRYGKADGFIKKYIGNGDMGEPIMNNKQCTKEEYEEELKTNWQTAYKVHPTYRELLQYLGTDLLRNQLHENVWVNALFAKYIGIDYTTCSCIDTTPDKNCKHLDVTEYPNWIITDTRFPNEADAIKSRGGLLIRVNRLINKRVYVINYDISNENWYGIVESYNGNGFYNVLNNVDDICLVHEKQMTIEDEHSSETSLDTYQFDEIIDNNGTIEDLITKVKLILIKHKII